ncbi:DUF4271 domain-containing protein [Aquimarina sp. W85]|uniref:DUF4271 domain-containing protein n=1 Tax=Aquimarina rhodophyticola TaxID=3342246 RepID=UPI003672164B
MQSLTREILSNDWITILLIANLALLALAKMFNSYHFSNFLLLFNTNKYILMHQKHTNLSTAFTIAITCMQCLVFSMLIYFISITFGWQINPYQPYQYLQILIAYSTILISKILIEKIIGIVFNIDTVINSYIFHKLTYRNFLAVLLLPLLFLFSYTITLNPTTTYLIIGVLALLQVITLISFYKKNENLIFNHLFYFILYLCALEFGPYFILYKLFIK